MIFVTPTLGNNREILDVQPATQDHPVNIVKLGPPSQHPELAMACLHDLAPELLVLIHRALNSPRDLYALTAASRVSLHIFDSHRVSILTSVLANSIQPAALHHALAISHVPPPSTDSPRRLLPQTSQAHLPLQYFLKQYFRGSLDFPTDGPRLAELCRVQMLVSRFSDDYFLHATRHVQASCTTEVASVRPIPLSPTERARLERAFFTYELYSRIFPIMPGSLRISMFSAREQFDYFLRRMEAWEVEEISSIHVYFTSLVRDIIIALEDRMVRRVRMSAVLKDKKSDKPVAVNDINKAGRDAELVPFTDLELHGLSLFEMAQKRNVPQFISTMASFGLEHIARLLDGDDETQKNMIQEHAPFGRGFLPEALNYTPERDSVTHPPASYAEEDVLDDDPRHPNLGYVLFSRQEEGLHHGIYDHFQDLVYNPLREGGYNVWDAARIKIPVFREYFEMARKVTRDTMLSRSWIKRKSVEERLRGVRIARGERTRIFRDFATPHYDSDGGWEEEESGSD